MQLVWLHASSHKWHRRLPLHSAWTNNHRLNHTPGDVLCRTGCGEQSRASCNHLVFQGLLASYRLLFRQVHPHPQTGCGRFSSKIPDLPVNVEGQEGLYVNHLCIHPTAASFSAASSAIRTHAPYVTMVASLPSRITSGTPGITVNSPIFVGMRSLTR